MKTSKTWWLVALILFTGGNVHAAEFYTGNIFSEFESAINAMFALATSSAFQGSLTGVGERLLYLGFMGMAVWYAVKNMGIGRGLAGFFDDLIPLIFTAGIAWIMMHGFGSAGNIVTIVQSTVDTIGSAVIPTHYTNGSPGSLVVQTLGKIMSMIERIWDTDLSNIDGNFIEAAVGFVTAAVIKGVGILLFTLFIAIMLGLFVANLIYSQIVFLIAAAFMPVFVAMLVFPPMSGLFDNWLRFTITALFTKIVGFVLINLAQTVLDGMVRIAGSLSSNGNGTLGEVLIFDFAMIASLCIMAMIMTMIMGQTQTIANNLIGAGVSGFKNWGELTRGPAAKFAKASHDAVYTTAGKTATLGTGHLAGLHDRLRMQDGKDSLHSKFSEKHALLKQGHGYQVDRGRKSFEKNFRGPRPE